MVSTPYMDEAARCNRLGFMSHGRFLMEGGPRELASLLTGRVLMLIAQPKPTAREVCCADPDIEDVAAFGERLHMRLRAGAPTTGPENVLDRLTASLLAAGVQIDGAARDSAHIGGRLYRSSGRRCAGKHAGPERKRQSR